LKSGKEWKRLPYVEEFTNRAACGCIALGGVDDRILIFGGLKTSTEFLGETWTLNIVTNELKQMSKKMVIPDYFSRASNTLGFKSDGLLYAVATESMNIHIYNRKEGVWGMIPKEKWAN